MPTLFMLGGLPGCGKSTYRKTLLNSEIIEFNNCSNISSDDYIVVNAKIANQTYKESFNQIARIATNKMNDDVEYAISCNYNMIWDQTNLNTKTRKTKLAKIPKHYKKVAIWFDVDLEIIFARNNERKAIGRDIPLHVLNSMIESMQPPIIDEGFDAVIVNDDLELTMLKNYTNNLLGKE
jgi:predicted kinase